MGASNGADWIQLAPADIPFQHKAAADVGHRCRDVFSPLRILRDLPQTSEVFETSEVSSGPAPQSGWRPSLPRRLRHIAHSLLTRGSTRGIVQHEGAGRRHYVVSPSLEPALHHRADFSIVEVAEARAWAWHSRRERPSTKVGR